MARAQAAGNLAVEYLSVADALARRFVCPGHDAEDLRQVARLGLMKAARRYREGSEHGFVPYAVPTILGEVKRYLRDQTWIVRPPRGILELRLRVRSVSPRLEQRLGHTPSPAELSRELNVGTDAIAEVQIADAAMIVDPIELCDSTDEPDARPAFVVGAVDPGFEHIDSIHALRAALEDASEEDLELIRLRFGNELTQQEIAGRLGISQMQVSRLLRRLLARLRRRMAA